MSLIREKSETELINWIGNHSKDNEDYDFVKKKDTYWNEFDNSDNLSEYDFLNVKDLSKELSRVIKYGSDTEELIKICTIASFKGKPNIKVAEDAENDLEIPGYVYVF